MIEMSVEKETVLIKEQPVDASVLQQSTETSNDGLKNPSNFAKETELQNERIAVNSGDVAAADSFIQSQNGIQPHKPHQQRLNKRRSTMSSGFKSPVSGKRRRRANSESECVLPTNFLMGGNIFDPLNLNSLLDDEVNRVLNAETPKSSPLPPKGRDPVEILIPRDITDPLNLNSCTGETSFVLTPFKSGGGRKRHRNRHHGTAGSARAVVTAGVEAVGEEVTQLNQAEPESLKLCITPQTESKSVSCNLPSSSKEDCPNSTASLKDESDTNLMSKQEIQKVKDQTDALNMHTLATQTSHRQRKRKRSNSRSENPTASSEKNTTTSSSSAFGSAQHPPIHKGQQKCNYQKGSQQNNQKNLNLQTPKQQQQKKKFQYGNYNQYYGYRNPGACEDVRLSVFRPEWFRGKEVLDLGCNTGHLTLTIAKNWRPVRMVGMDIDKALIHAAKQNIRHYLSEMHMLQSREVKKEGRDLEEDKAGDEEPKDTITKTQRDECEIKTEKEKEIDWGSKEKQKTSETQIKKPENGEQDGSAHQQLAEESNAEKIDSKGFRESESCLFPVSLRISRGPIAAPPLPDTQTLPPGNFPANVTFIAGNYVLDNDALLETQREEFDVVLCLSVTKWVHLNWGDVGLKRLFHRVYRHLRPGGLFILEPQPWSSYSKRKKLTDTIYSNYFSIQLKPEQFSSFLTSEVGFSSYELLGTSNNSARGFQRPIYVFYKDPALRT